MSKGHGQRSCSNSTSEGGILKPDIKTWPPADKATGVPSESEELQVLLPEGHAHDELHDGRLHKISSEGSTNFQNCQSATTTTLAVAEIESSSSGSNSSTPSKSMGAVASPRRNQTLFSKRTGDARAPEEHEILTMRELETEHSSLRFAAQGYRPTCSHPGELRTPGDGKVNAVTLDSLRMLPQRSVCTAACRSVKGLQVFSGYLSNSDC